MLRNYRIYSHPVIVTLFLAFLGILLRGFPSDPDQIFLKSQELGVFSTFLWFSFCTVYWGQFFLSTLGLRSFGFFGALALGSAFLSVLAFALGHLGWVGYSSGAALFTLLQLGPLILVAWEKHRPTQIHSLIKVTLSNREEALKIIGWIAVGFVFLSRALNASLAHGTSDPFLYHLLGPRLWADAGFIFLPSSIPITYQSTWWEMLILIGQVILGGPSGGGLIEGHLFGQYLHLFFGFGGSLLAIKVLFRNFSGPREWVYTACLGAILSQDLTFNSWLAKNDWGVIFWSLASSIFLLTPQTKLKREAALGGFFMGLAIMAKLNSVFFLGTVFVVWVLSVWTSTESRKWRLLGIVAGSAGIGILPIAVRNWIATGNPLFPFFAQWTQPSLLSLPTQRANFLFPVHWHFQFSYWQKQFERLIADSPLHWALVILPFSVPLWRDRIPKLLALITPFSLLWFLSAEIRNSFVRWGSVSLVLAGALAVLGIAEIISRLSLKSWIRDFVFLALTGLLVHLTLVPEFWKKLDALSPSYVIRNAAVHMGGDSKAWLRMNASFLSPVFTTGDNQVYYIASLPFSPLNDDPRVSRRVDHLRLAPDLIDELTQMGFKYVLDTAHWEKRYWTPQAQILDQITFLHPEAIVYLGLNSQVIDLPALKNSVNQSCSISGDPISYR